MSELFLGKKEEEKIYKQYCLLALNQTSVSTFITFVYYDEIKICLSVVLCFVIYLF